MFAGSWASICEEKNLFLFRNSQQTSSRIDLDSGTSPKQCLLLSLAGTFNDDNFIARIPALPNLHEDFRVEIFIGKEDYEMTPARVADILQSRKLEMKDISDRFQRSGNGENMMGEDGGVVDGAKWSSFLRGKPSDLCIGGRSSKRMTFSP